MAKDKITEYDSTANNNTLVGDVNLQESSMLPSDVNNAIREVMSHLKEFSAGTSGVDVLSFQDNDNSHQLKFQAPSSVTTSTDNRYYKLEDGLYNGQIKKIALHPVWNGNNIDINISQFCDADGNIFPEQGNPSTTAHLILNKGGQTLNLLYITDTTSSYWILLDNNFDFV